MDMLTTKELARRYPVAGTNYEHAWFRLLDKLRMSGNLKEGKDWEFQRGVSKRPVRVYVECAVLRIVWHYPHTFAESIRMEHRQAIRQKLNGKGVFLD